MPDTLRLETAPDLLTFDEVRQLLRVPPDTIKWLVDRGDLPVSSIGRHMRVRRAAVERLITS